MIYATDHIATILRNARIAKGFSQRALSRLSGVPQSHISKIESGAVDLRLSSLVELARVLDMELTLVPRKSVPAVNSVVRSTENKPRHSHSPNSTLNEMKRLHANIETIKMAFPAATEIAQIQRQFRDLQHLKVPAQSIKDIREINKSLQSMKNIGNLDAVREILRDIQHLRNSIAHGLAVTPSVQRARPAYALEEDDHGE